MNPSVLLLIFK